MYFILGMWWSALVLEVAIGGVPSGALLCALHAADQLPKTSPVHTAAATATPVSTHSATLSAAHSTLSAAHSAHAAAHPAHFAAHATAHAASVALACTNGLVIKPQYGQCIAHLCLPMPPVISQPYNIICIGPATAICKVGHSWISPYPSLLFQ